jgi:hypothetical protein
MCTTGPGTCHVSSPNLAKFRSFEEQPEYGLPVWLTGSQKQLPSQLAMDAPVPQANAVLGWQAVGTLPSQSYCTLQVNWVTTCKMLRKTKSYSCDTEGIVDLLMTSRLMTVKAWLWLQQLVLHRFQLQQLLQPWQKEEGGGWEDHRLLHELQLQYSLQM